MTKKTRIETDLNEFCHFLDIDQATLQRVIRVGVERFLGPPVDPRINAFLKNDPPKTNPKMEA